MNMNEIKEFMELASKAYYDGCPIISNEEYDALERRHGQLLSASGDVEHMCRMYSLKKAYPGDPVPIDVVINEVNCTVKLDGAAVSLLIVNGDLKLALTRGNGIKGRDITEKLKILLGDCSFDYQGIYQVDGEVVASSYVDNPRNYTSGALNLKDLNEFSSRVLEGDMQFFAYSIRKVGDNPKFSDSYKKDMEFLTKSKILTVFDIVPDSIYPTDGLVYRIDNNDTFYGLGYTDKFPRGAYAYKEQQDAVETTLLDVVWETGKSGKVTPVAILEPVMIGDAKISRATLNNIAYIRGLGLEIGCTVEVIRSGEIIPKIIGRV